MRRYETGPMTRRSSYAKAARCLAIAAALIAIDGHTASAQDGPSTLSLLPVSGDVSVGSELEDRLSTADYMSGGRRVRRYDLQGEQGDPVIIDLISDDFDSYLVVVGPDGTEVATDDDSGGACHARISMFLEEAGTFAIVVASLSSETGAFTLRLDDRQGPPTPGDCGGGDGSDILDIVSGIDPEGTISLDGPSDAEGSLDSMDAQMDGGRLETWLLTGEPGQTVVVDLMSRAFDTMLYVVQPDRFDFETDDDSGGSCNSRMEIQLEAEPHLLVVRSFDPSASGGFTLRVSAEAGPMSEVGCPSG